MDKGAEIRVNRAPVLTLWAAVEQLAASLEPEELNRIGFRLYERFRPDVPPGATGWGTKGVLDPGRIRQAAG